MLLSSSKEESQTKVKKGFLGFLKKQFDKSTSKTNRT